MNSVDKRFIAAGVGGLLWFTLLFTLVILDKDDKPAGPLLARYVVRSQGEVGSVTYRQQGDTRQNNITQRTFDSGTFSVSRGEFLYVSGQNDRGGVITCEIYLNGVRVKRTTSNGDYAICTASGKV